MEDDRAQMYFFFFKFATKSLEKKKRGGPVAPLTGDSPCRPPQGRQAPVARWGATDPFFFRDFVANLKKKKYI